MYIVIVGGLGTETRQLENALAEAIKELGLRASIGVASGAREMAAYDVHRMPALVVDGKVAIEGVVPDLPEIKRILMAAANKGLETK